MTLFDGKPLTKDEVSARLVCQCGHSAVRHGASGCYACYSESDPESEDEDEPCEGFKEAIAREGRTA